MAPRLRGSVTPSSATTSASGRASSSSASAYGYGSQSATTPWWSGRSASAVTRRRPRSTSRTPELSIHGIACGRLARAHDLAHAPAAAQRLAHGLQPVDEVGRGAARRRGQPSSGTTCGPCGVSRTPKPSAAIGRAARRRGRSRAPRGRRRAPRRARAPPRTLSASLVERREPEHVERAHEQVGRGRPTAAGAGLTAGHGGVERAREAVQLGQGARRVEVVGHVRRRSASKAASALRPDAPSSPPAAAARRSGGRCAAPRAGPPPSPRLLERRVGVVHRAAVVRLREEHQQRLAPHALERVGQPLDVAERLRHLLAGEPQHAVVHPRRARSARRRPPTGRARSRGAGRSGRGRRRARRSPRRAARAPSPSTRCASRAARAPRASPRRCPRPACWPSRARSRAASACPRRARRASPRSARPAAGPRARRTAEGLDAEVDVAVGARIRRALARPAARSAR